jgi:hypothetical protein
MASTNNCISYYPGYENALNNSFYYPQQHPEISTQIPHTRIIHTKGHPKQYFNTYSYQSDGPKYGPTVGSCIISAVGSNILNNVGHF